VPLRLVFNKAAERSAEEFVVVCDQNFHDWVHGGCVIPLLILRDSRGTARRVAQSGYYPMESLTRRYRVSGITNW
jgi:hypothetical protein